MNTKTTNVLLVEDDSVTRQLVKRLLSGSDNDFNCSLQTASTLSSAIKQMEKRRFDNVLLDLNLPDSSGVSTVQRVHNLDPDVSIVVITGNADKETERNARIEGADNYLVKGKDIFKSLVQHIRFAIEHKKTLELIRQKYEYFRTVFDNVPAMIICLSTEGRIVEFNKEAERLWDCKRKDVLERSFLNRCIPHGDRFRLYSNLRKTIAGESIRGIQTVLTCKVGIQHLLFWNFETIKNDQGRTEGVVAVAHDISKDILTANKFLAAPRFIFNPTFNDTVNMVLGSLNTIIKKIDAISGIDAGDAVKKLADELPYNEYFAEQLSPKKAAAVERLVLSLLSSGHDKADHSN